MHGNGKPRRWMDVAVEVGSYIHGLFHIIYRVLYTIPTVVGLGISEPSTV